METNQTATVYRECGPNGCAKYFRTKERKQLLREIFSFIFDRFTDPLTLPIEPLYEWIILGIIGLIAYAASFRIVGDMYESASANNVYSNAILVTKGRMTGGLFGGMHNSSEFTLDNCWFDGSVSVHNKTATTAYVGGLSGGLIQGYLDMNNCLLT